MKSIRYEHAAQRKTYVGVVYDEGAQKIKNEILENIGEKYARLHLDGKIHIHELEGYKLTYNCLTPNILASFPYPDFKDYSDVRKILEILGFYKHIVVSLGIEQLGGIAFANFDEEIEIIIKNLGITPSENNLQILHESIGEFLKWVNDARDRCGQVQFYLSLNIGLAAGEIGRFVASSVLTNFQKSDYIRPNIIFKLKNGINHQPQDKNYDLYCQAIECTCKKMIPTYLLCDSDLNQNIDPEKMAIMGCRTKVIQNENGEATSIGRGNIAFITINLPHIAFETQKEAENLQIEEKFSLFKQKWTELAIAVKEILLDRYEKVAKLEQDDFPINQKYPLWIKDFNKVQSLKEVFENGTLSIGFIGLSEAFEILTGQKYYTSEINHNLAISLVKFMRETINQFRKQYKMNFTLLATSGELISGRFPSIDKKFFSSPLIDKEFYTNSFHVDVDSCLNPFEKIKFEGPFHQLCNGGCISYIEFQSAPLNNHEAIKEIIDWATKCNVNYFGMNYPMDRCTICGTTGTFDVCEKCGSNKIQRIRRVSGYLEDLAFFTPGKKAEVAHRKPNPPIKKP